MDKRMIIGSDRSGFPLKEAIKTYLTDKGYQIEDVGMLDEESFQAFYQVAPKAARKIQHGEYDRAILCCGTGAGMAMVANKFKGVYAVVVESSYTAKMSKIVNNANVLAMGGWVIAPQQAFDMIDQWLDANFTQGFPEDRQRFLENAYAEVKKVEEENMQPA